MSFFIFRYAFCFLSLLETSNLRICPMKSFLNLLLLSLLIPAAAFGENYFSVFNLKCEQADNPLGVETLVPRFSWQIRSDRRNFVQSSYEILVADDPGLLSKNKGSIWDSGKVGSDRSVLVPFGGEGLKSGTTYYWKVRIFDGEGNPSAWSAVKSFTMGLLSERDWAGAAWISLDGDRKDEIVTPGLHGSGEVDKRYDRSLRIGMYRLPQFRKEFVVDKPVRRAVAYVSGLGHFDMFLNGEKVGDHFLDPGWTKYDKHALYVPLDVTEYLRAGENAVGVMLGNGFFNIPRERYFKLLASYGAPRLIMNIRVEYSDGEVANIVTDGSWKAAESPIAYSSIYGGEDYDANSEQPGWTAAGFDDSAWQEPLVLEWKTGLVAQSAPPLTVRDTIPAVRIFKNAKGRWVYDLGQNFSGVIRLSIKSGDRRHVKLYPAELLNPDSTINQSASGGPYWFGYTTDGRGYAEWQPQFTYYGFRYVEVEGAVPAGAENAAGEPGIVSAQRVIACDADGAFAENGGGDVLLLVVFTRVGECCHRGGFAAFHPDGAAGVHDGIAVAGQRQQCTGEDADGIEAVAHARFFDVVIAHADARGAADGPDFPRKGVVAGFRFVQIRVAGAGSRIGQDDVFSGEGAGEFDVALASVGNLQRGAVRDGCRRGDLQIPGAGGIDAGGARAAVEQQGAAVCGSDLHRLPGVVHLERAHGCGGAVDGQRKRFGESLRKNRNGSGRVGNAGRPVCGVQPETGGGGDPRGFLSGRRGAEEQKRPATCERVQTGIHGKFETERRRKQKRRKEAVGASRHGATVRIRHESRTESDRRERSAAGASSESFCCGNPSSARRRTCSPGAKSCASPSMRSRPDNCTAPRT